MVKLNPEMADFLLDRADDSWLSQLRDAEAPLVLGQLGRFELLAEINRGGQGIVYRARQPGTGRDVAIKRLLAGSLTSQQARLRFEREIEVAAQLKHPNIVTVFSREDVDGQPLLAMEWIEGQPITRWAHTDTGTPRALRDQLEVFLRVCTALEHAHQRGVLHRDIKPGNILVDREDQPHVLDFGLARLISEPVLQTLTMQFAGTLAYAAPEQLHGQPEKIDTRSDLYSLGIVLYEMLTGQLPYPVGTNLTEAVTRIEQAQPLSPSRLRPELDRELELIVLKCLDKEPSRRYQSVTDLADDIRRYLRGEAIQAHPPTLTYQLGKLARRHRGPFISAILLFIVVAGFSIITFSLWQLSDRARQNETQARQVAQHISDFLQEMLASINPDIGGTDITVREVLDQAASDATTQLQDFPEVEAAVRQTMGEAYTALSLYPEADEQLQRALTLRQQLFGVHHIDTAATQAAIGYLRGHQAEYPEAEQLLRTALQIQIDLLGAQHLTVAKSHYILGQILQAAGRYNEAKPELDSALQIRQQLLPAGSPEISQIMNDLASYYANTGQIAEAENLYRQTLELLRTAHPQDHPDVENALSKLGNFLLGSGKLDEAEPLLSEAQSMGLRLWGEDHIRIAGHLEEQARLQRVRGHDAEAETLYRQALAMMIDFAGENHSSIVELKINLAETIYAQNRLDEAQTLLEESLLLSTQLLSPNHQMLNIARNNLAAILYGKGEYASAETVFRDILAAEITQYGPSSPAAASALNNLGMTLLNQGELIEARQRLEVAVQMTRSVEADNPQSIATREANLAKVLIAQGELNAAEPLLTEALTLRQQSLGEQHPQTAQSLFALGDLFEKQERWAEAETRYRECWQMRQLLQPAGHWTTAATASALGNTLTHQQRYTDAEPLLLDGFNQLREAKGVEDTQTQTALQRLIALYEAWNQPAQADQYRPLLINP
ncbi:MAG: Serine/threonine-protein kinase PknD [Phycisphaerae bacterium]|nr:Serine/threonine-protein kinase PknD [Phycisphaerae bacterium]